MLTNRNLVRKQPLPEIAVDKENVRAKGGAVRGAAGRPTTLRDIGNRPQAQNAFPARGKKDDDQKATFFTKKQKQPVAESSSQSQQTRKSSLLAGSLARTNLSTHPPIGADKSKPFGALRRSNRLASIPKNVEDVQANVVPRPMQTSTQSQPAMTIIDEEHSAAFSTGMIDNIDAEHHDDPQMATEYVDDIYGYMRALEIRYSIRESYLAGTELNPKMRSVLIDWLAQVSHRFHLLPETYYTTVALVDRFLQEVIVSREKLQLLSVGCMFIASKYEEIFAPEINDFVYITDKTYTSDQILAMERNVLKTLRFELGRPLPLHFLRRFSKASKAEAETHFMAKYFLESTQVEYGLCHVRPSLLAASSLWLALKLLNPQAEWTATLIHYTTYKVSDLVPVVRVLGRFLVKVHTNESKYQFIRKKFGASKFEKISSHQSLTPDSLRMAMGLENI